MHPTSDIDLLEALRTHVRAALPDARVEAGGGNGHFTLLVESEAFRGQPMLACHRLVMAAIAPLMAGTNSPVHAIDQLRTRTPTA